MNRLSFEYLNLKRNPFGELSSEQRISLAMVDLDAAVQHLQQAQQNNLRPVVQFVGEKGHGKTTHLLALAAQFPESVYHYIPEDERRCVPPHGEPLLVDEAQRLTLWQRTRLFRSHRPLVLGTHRDFAPHLQRVGRSVLTIAANRQTTSKQIAEILNARIRAARRTNGAIPTVSLKTADRLYEQFGPDIRSILHEFYDVFQQLKEIDDV